MDFTTAFPHRVYLSVPTRQDRREVLASRLRAAGVDAEWWPALDAQPMRGETRGFKTLAHRAHAVSVRLALRDARWRGFETILMLEDDAVFHPEFRERIAAVELPEDWGLFYLGCQHIETPECVSPGLVRVRRALDMQAVVFRQAHYGRVRAAVRGRGKGAVGEKCMDVSVSDLHKEIPTYAAFPNLIWQAESWSDIARRKYSNYEPDGSQRLWRHVVEPLHQVTQPGCEEVWPSSR